MSIVSFLHGSRRLYDEPRYALVICLCASLVFIFLAAFSAPMTDAIYLVKLTVQDDVVVVLGTLGYCWKMSGVEACSKVVAGYQLGQEISALSPITQPLPLIPTWSTTVLCLQVVTFGVTFIVCAVTISAHFVHTYFARWPLVYCGIAALLQLTCYVSDEVLFSVTRSAVGQSGTVKLGNGTWLAMVAFILLCGAILGDCVQLRGRRTHRNTEKALTITPFTMSDVEVGRQEDFTSRVLDLIPANERRSLDQTTIDIIFHSLRDEATSTSPSTMTESTFEASHVSPVNDDNNPYRLESGRTYQAAPNIDPIAKFHPSFPNKATTLPNAVVPRQAPLGPRGARGIPAQLPIQPLMPARRKPTFSRYAPSSYYTYQSQSDSERTTSTTTFFPRSSTHAFLSRATTMRSGVLPGMSEKHISTPSVITLRSDDFQLPHFAGSVSSASTISTAWSSVFRKLSPTDSRTPPLPHFPISSHRFGGDRFVEAEVSDDTWSLSSAVESSDLEYFSDMQHGSEFDYPIVLDARHSSQDGRIRRLI